MNKIHNAAFGFVFFSVIPGPYGNHGCVKGSIDKALEYVVDEGINTQDVYPFQGAQKKCHYKSGKSSATLRSFQRVKRGSEEDLMSAVAMEGPIAAGIDASHNTFRVSAMSTSKQNDSVHTIFLT